MVIGLLKQLSYKVLPPVDSVQLVNITLITMVYGTQITIVNGDYKPTYITWGAPPCKGFEMKCTRYDTSSGLYHIILYIPLFTK